MSMPNSIATAWRMTRISLLIEEFNHGIDCGTAIYASHLESPGTKAYTVAEAQRLLRRFAQVSISTVLTHGDLLESDAGQRHRGWLLSLAKRLWPRRFSRWALPGHGLFC